MKKKFKFKLVDDWKDCWKWISIRCLALTCAVSTTWNTLPTEWQRILLENSTVGLAFKIISVVSFIGIIGRLLKQDKDEIN